MRLLVTRPQPDAQAQAQALEARGHRVLLAPLLRIEPAADEPLPVEGIQAVMATSRNALRALDGRREREALAALPLFTVGEAGAALARTMGFARVTAAGGTAQDLVRTVAARCRPGDGPLLHLAGDRLAFDLKGALQALGFAVRQAVVYRARPAAALPDPAQAALAAGELDAVVLMSPRTAALFATLVARHGLTQAARGVRYFCLSGAVAERLALLEPLPPGAIAVAARPSQEELLALIAGQAADCG